MTVPKFELIQPTEENGLCVFPSNLENDPEVFFHSTKASTYDSIMERGFCSAKDLKVGNLESVSYAKRSSGCFANLGCSADEDLVIFAVRFTEENLRQVTVNPSDIYVYRECIQPQILGFACIPSGFSLS